MPSRNRLIALAVAAALPAVAFAQNTEDKDIQEIIVTATKRETTLQDVPFSVAAQTEQQIRNSGATNVVEFARNIPGLAITDLGPGQSQVAIRGISAGQVVRDQPGVKESVGIYLDESPISVALFTPDLDLFDLSRVEVLRGPQGTLFGAGSTSGTLRYITAQPVLGKFEGTIEVGVHDLSGGEIGGGLKGAVNLPMGDKAALRLVGYRDELSGFVDSIYPGRGRTENVDGGSKTGGRIALTVQATDSFTITPRLIFQKLETDGYPREDFYNILGNSFTTTEPAVSPGEREQVTQFREGIDDDFRLADLKLQWNLGTMDLTSISSYTDREVVVLRDASQLTGSVTFGSFGGTSAQTRLDSPLFDTTDLQAFSQEIRLSSSANESFQWLVGGFYQDVDRRYGQNLPTPGYDAIVAGVGLDPAQFLSPPDTPFFSDINYDFKQTALFGEATWRFNERWAITGGVRYYDFEEDRTLTFHGVFVDTVRTDEPGATSSDGISPRLILAFNPNDDMQFTAQMARGFRLGGVNDPLNEGLCPVGTPDNDLFNDFPLWDDEKVTNYELGAKTRLADGRVTFNAAVFFSDIDNLQVIADALSCSSRIVLNAQAEAKGVELELFARPNDSWDFGISATWVDAEITDTRLTPTGDPLAGIREGNRLPTAPELQAAASATYSWPWRDTQTGYATLTLQHVGSSFTQLADQEFPFGCVGCAGAPAFIPFGAPTVNSFTFPTELPSYDIGNLRVGIRSEEWEFAVFLNNIWDEHALTSVDRERGTRARVAYLTNAPRSYGVTFRRSF